MSEPPARVLLMVNSLHFGGAEKHAVSLLNNLDRQQLRLSAVWLKRDDALLPQLDTARLHDTRSLEVTRKLDWSAVRSLATELDRQQIEVVLCTNEYPALYAWLAAARSKNPPRLVEVFHTTEYATLKERLQMLLYRRVFRGFDLLVYVSEQQRQYWRRHGLRAQHDLTIHNGIDCEAFSDHYSSDARHHLRAQLGFGAQDYVIALCAALRPEKAHGDLLQALAQLRKSIPTARALLIGDGPERPRIEAQITALGLGDAVHITGFLRDVRPLLAASDVAVLTSHKVETFSIAALEAMSLGKPMVLTRIGGAAEQIVPGENGFLYEPGDIQALTGHLLTLADSGRRADMGANAARRVRAQFSESTMIDAYSEQLLRLARERRAAALEN